MISGNFKHFQRFGIRPLFFGENVPMTESNGQLDCPEPIE